MPPRRRCTLDAVLRHISESECGFIATGNPSCPDRTSARPLELQLSSAVASPDNRRCAHRPRRDLPAMSSSKSLIPETDSPDTALFQTSPNHARCRERHRLMVSRLTRSLVCRMGWTCPKWTPAGARSPRFSLCPATGSPASSRRALFRRVKQQIR